MPRLCLLLLVCFLAAAAGAAEGPPPDGTLSVREYGAKGDGRTDDTAAVQAAIDAAGRAGGTLLFPPGTYVVTAVGLRPGVRYLGYGATIRRPARQSKWTRTFDAARPGYLYSGDQDSAPLVVEGFRFDGNRGEQGPYAGYELEQAHLLNLMADPARPGRLRAQVLHCTFEDGVGDAISVYTNVDVQVRNCRARDCFRGGLTVTGGHTRVQVSDFATSGAVHPTGIDVEVDGPGYGGSHRVDATLDGLVLQDGDFDVGVSGPSTVLGTNILAPRAPFHLYGGGTATLRFTNCVFGVGEFSDTANRIVLPGQVSFSHCTFQVDGKSGTSPGRWAAAHVYWSIGNTPARGQSLTFTDCDFRVEPGVAPSDTVYAVYVEAGSPADENRLLLRGGRISPEFDYGVWLSQGGRMVAQGLTTEADTAFRLGAAAGYSLEVTVDGVEVPRCRTYMHLVTHDPASRITHRNVVLDAGRNVLGTDYGLAGNTYRGGRTVLALAPPTAATHGLLGDIYRVPPVPGMPYEWVCTASGTGSAAVWKPLSRVED